MLGTSLHHLKHPNDYKHLLCTKQKKGLQETEVLNWDYLKALLKRFWISVALRQETHAGPLFKKNNYKKNPDF